MTNSKVISHPSAPQTAQACIEQLIDKRHDIAEILGVIFWKDGTCTTFNSPGSMANQAYAIAYLQKELFDQFDG